MSNQNGKKKCSKFVKVLYSMLKSSTSFLEWSADQTYFTITNVLGFIENSLPTYFKHSNLSSFIRQLNLYGFKKLPTNDQTPENSYYHQYFKKNQSNKLYKIQRRFLSKSNKSTPKSQSINSSSNSGESKKSVYLSKLQQCQNQLKKLRQQNYKLAEQNGGLKHTIKQAQFQMFPKNNIGFTQYNHEYKNWTHNFQNGFNPMINSYLPGNMVWPYMNYTNLQQLSGMNGTSSGNSNDSKQSSQDNKQCDYQLLKQ